MPQIKLFQSLRCMPTKADFLALKWKLNQGNPNIHHVVGQAKGSTNGMHVPVG